MSSSSCILTVDQLAVSFGGIRALSGVTFSVNEGSITAIIGPNGAGKTTVFNCISGFYRPTGGSIVYTCGKERHDLGMLVGERLFARDFLDPACFFRKLYYKIFGGSHKVAALGIARTFQNIRLFQEMTVTENLLIAQHRSLNRNLITGLINFGNYRKSESNAVRKAYQWLEIMNLTGEANRLAGELSYGQQRRLEIARAMCTGAKLICLDEPAAGLNHQETAELARLVRRLRDEFKATVLLIEHDMALVMNISDHIVVLDHGEVIAEGAPAQVRTNPAVLKAYLGEEEEV